MTGFRLGVRLALDWGEARIGVAACDPAGSLAYPVEAVRAGASALDRMLQLIAEYEPIEIVLGLPRSLSGREGPAAARIRAAGLELRSTLDHRGLDVPVRLIDERLSTVTASQRLQQAGKRSKQQRSVIDAAAAVVILEYALALERSGNPAPGELLSGPGATD